MNRFSHLAQVSKLPTGGLESLEVQALLESAVYASSPSSPSELFFPSFFAFFLAAALSFASAAFVSLRFFVADGAAAGSSGSSKSSDAYPEVCGRSEFIERNGFMMDGHRLFYGSSVMSPLLHHHYLPLVLRPDPVPHYSVQQPERPTHWDHFSLRFSWR